MMMSRPEPVGGNSSGFKNENLLQSGFKEPRAQSSPHADRKRLPSNLEESPVESNFSRLDFSEGKTFFSEKSKKIR